MPEVSSVDGSVGLAGVPKHDPHADQPQPQPAKGKGNKQRMPKAKDAGLRLAQLGMVGQGFVKVVKEAGFGFISSPDLDEQLFFHASELMRSEGEDGPSRPFQESVSPGDEVEFVVGQNTGSRMNLVAQQVRKLPAHTVRATIVTADWFIGRISTELNSGSWRSQDSANGKITYTRRLNNGQDQEETIQFRREGVLKRQALKIGESVQFQICVVNHENLHHAINVEPVKESSTAQSETILHGFVKELNKTGGLIRCVEHDRRFGFRTADVVHSSSPNLRKGKEVMFSTITDMKGNERVVRLDVLPDGSLEAERDLGFVKGRVVKSLGSSKAEECGLLLTPERPSVRAQFTSETSCITEGGAKELEVDDEVAFHLTDDLKNDVRVAQDLRVLCKGKLKRELGQVRTVKSNFGFIACCQRSGQLFFHSSGMIECGFSEMKKGDDVEFSVERHPERGIMAVRVKKMPPGSAVFETISETCYKGIVSVAPVMISSGVISSGLLDYTEDGIPSKMLFSANDFQEEVRQGDYVTFHIANNENAVKKVESLGSMATRMNGRHATNGKVTKLQGTVSQVLQGFGFIEVHSSENDPEMRLFYHYSEVVDQVELMPGDVVTLLLSKGPRMKDDLARRVTKIGVAAPAPSQPKEPAKIIQKPVSHPIQPVRTPAMPDGTKGFYAGRGRGLPLASVSEDSFSQPGVPGKLLINSDHKPMQDDGTAANGTKNEEEHSSPNDSRKPRKKKPAASQAGGQPAASSIVGMKSEVVRTLSGHALNPNAAEFQPGPL